MEVLANRFESPSSIMKVGESGGLMLINAENTDNKKPALGGFLVVASGNFATTRS